MTLILGKRGVLDQIITSVVVLFAVVLLMGIYIIVTSAVGRVEEVKARPTSQATVMSRTILELFLADSVDIDGQKKLVKDAVVDSFGKYRLRERDGVPRSEAIAIFKPFEELFDREYSCNGQNELLLIAIPVTAGELGSTPGKIAYLDYPLRKWSTSGEGLPRNLAENSANERDRLLYDLHNSFNIKDINNGGKDGYYFFHVKESAVLIVKVNKKC